MRIITQGIFESPNNSKCWKPLQPGIAVTTISIISIKKQLLYDGAAVIYTHLFRYNFLNHMLEC